MRLLESGQEKRYDPVFSGNTFSSFIFTGSIPTGSTASWTRSYNIYSTQSSEGFQSSPSAIIPGKWNASNATYFYLNSPIRAFAKSVYPVHSQSYLNARYTGQLTQTQSFRIFDTCRGQAAPYSTGKYNFYQGFHPMGYFSPPFGEVTALSEVSDAQYGTQSTLLYNGGCATLNYKEYNQLRGIVSANIFGSENLKPINVGSNPILNKISPIHSPYEECPPQLTKPFYFTELLFSYGAGTYAGGIAGNPYNHNPIPTALDYLDLQLTSRYNLTESEEQGVVITGVGETEDFTNVANYSAGPNPSLENDLLLNNKLTYNDLCQYPAMEQSTTAGMSIGGSLDLLEYDPASPLNAGSVSPSFNYNPWHYWHFTFKENHDYLPFSNSQQSSVGVGIHARPTSRGTELFEAKLADTDHWWENRQCPETVDFLPWTFGATVYDCPRDYFEIPYYSAIGKFGYFGTRFQVQCNKLLRDTANDRDEEKTPVPVFEIEYPMTAPAGYSQGSYDGGGASSDYYFDNLLAIAKREQDYTEWAVGNRGYYLWANSELVESSPTYAALVQQYPKFAGLFGQLKSVFSGKLASLQSYVSGSGIDVRVDPVTFEEDYDFYNENYNNAADFTNLNDFYHHFAYVCRREITGQAAIDNYQKLLNDYGFLLKKSPGGDVYYEAYQSGIEKQEERIRTRYLLNMTYGNPIDLFPTNHIFYSFDDRSEYENSSLWGKKFVGGVSSSSFGAGGLQLPEVKRRYFEGVFGSRANISGVLQMYHNYIKQYPNELDNNPNKQFTLGAIFKNPSCGRMMQIGAMIGTSEGHVVDTQLSTQTTNTNAWLALGYNEIGKLDGNFSCFTPVLLQQPKNAFCKIGQRPTFRAYAVDYHTIPEDKIGVRHPEIYYWADKLKLLSKTNQYLYPMKYIWGRVPASMADTYLKGNYTSNSIQWADTNGEWCCLEDDRGTNCTFIHPKECVRYDGTGVFTNGYNGSNPSSYVFLQGIKEVDSSRYLYFCLASGRYGIRGSDLSAVEADKFLLTNVAYMNGGGATPSISLKMVTDGSLVNNGYEQDGAALNESFSATPGSMGTTSYDGLKTDQYVIPEEVMVKKRYIRAGGGQNVGFGFDGGNQYRGFLRSYSPETIEDTRGLRATNHRPVDYGVLKEYKLNLTDKLGGAIYGYSHLPVVNNAQTIVGRQGIRIEAALDGVPVEHKTINRPAEIGMTNPPSPMKSAAGYANQVPNIAHVGQLYNHDYPGGLGTTTSWQFHQNLGCVRRFGRSSSYADKGGDFIFVRDMSSANPQGGLDAFNYCKDVIVTDTTLAGANAGFVSASLGRKMLYFVEAFDRFYILCDAKAKYNVQNKSFIAPGLRFGDAPFQYGWMGQPSDMYLTRKAMYGPYAYQWKVARHNRDRLGNGMSEGFYSMGWNQRYSLMYDLPAIYGLYCKTDEPSQSKKNTIAQIKAIKQLAFPNSNPRRLYLGRRGTAAEGYGYGDIRANCEEISSAAGAVFNGSSTTPNPAAIASNGYAAVCAYYDLSSSNLFDGSEYYCSSSNIRNGICFDPCLSIRYSHGIPPGGKSLTHMSNNAPDNPYGGTKFKTILSANESNLDTVVHIDTNTNTKTVLRGPKNTRYAYGIRTEQLQIAKTEGTTLPSRRNYSISPCEPGGADHCNYTTPTLHVGGNSSIIGYINGLSASNYNIFTAL